MKHSVTISGKFNGPPTSANGGYASGLLASVFGPDAAVEARLMMPPPLEKPLTLELSEAEAKLTDGEKLVGIAKQVVLDLAVPTLPETVHFGTGPIGPGGTPVESTDFTTCFVCGVDRAPKDGLCLYSRMIDNAPGLVGDTWELHKGLAGPDGTVNPLYIWAALDCPGYFACAAGKPALLGQLTTEIITPLKAEGTATVIGWDMGTDGRKYHCGTAVFDADGVLVAKAKGLWISIDPAKMPS